MLKPEEIKKFIDEDNSSERKNQARVGQRYYEAQHDIKSYKILTFNKEGELEEDENVSNIKISHAFFTELVDQQVQYMLSGGQFAHSDKPELQEKLDEYFDDEFIAELNDCLTDVCVDGFGYMYAYIGEDERLHFEKADALGVVEVRAKDTNDNVDYIIYYYDEKIAKSNKKIRRIQVWDTENTYYFVQENGTGKIAKDEERELNPRPHIVYKEGNDDYYNSLGFIPFFRLDNNRKQKSNLSPIKDIIDDYDLMNCSLSNNLQDFTDALYVVKGYKGEKSLEKLKQNLKNKKVISTGAEGDVEIKTIDIPYQARQTKLDVDEKNIYRFGMGFNSSQSGDGNITNIVIKSRYTLLDLKANKLEFRLKKFLAKLLRVILDEINTGTLDNDEDETGYTKKDVKFEFERVIMTNDLDTAQTKLTEAQVKQTAINTILSAEGILGIDIVAERLCEVLDIDYEEIKDQIPKEGDEDYYIEEGENNENV